MIALIATLALLAGLTLILWRPVRYLFLLARGDFSIRFSDPQPFSDEGWRIVVEDHDPLGQADPSRGGAFLRPLALLSAPGRTLTRRRWRRAITETMPGRIRWIHEGETQLELSIGHLDVMQDLASGRTPAWGRPYRSAYYPIPVAVISPDGKRWNT